MADQQLQNQGAQQGSNENNTYIAIKLTKDTYTSWKWQFKNILTAKELDSIFNINERDLNFQRINAKALALLGSTLDRINLSKVNSYDKFMDAWKALERSYECKTLYEPQQLYAKFNRYKIRSISEVSNGLSELQNIVNQLKNLGETVSDNNYMGAIISALPKEYATFEDIWSKLPVSERNVENLIAQIMADVSRYELKNEESSRALTSKKKVYSRQSNNNDRNVCKYCKEKGHWIKDCPSLKTPYDPNFAKKKSNNNRFNKSNQKDSGNNGMCFAATRPSKDLELSDPSVWIVDSGCTHHMSPFINIFSSLNEYNSEQLVHLGDDSSLKVIGFGTIETMVGTMKNVLFVPELQQNLFSVSQAVSYGLKYIGEDDHLVFMKLRQRLPIFIKLLKYA